MYIEMRSVYIFYLHRNKILFLQISTIKKQKLKACADFIFTILKVVQTSQYQ